MSGNSFIRAGLYTSHQTRVQRYLTRRYERAARSI